jgi:predicted nucleotidyltransferase
VPLKLALPPDLQQRLAGLGEAIAACSEAVEFAYLFGSAAAGTTTPRSDIDIAVHVSDGVDPHQLRLAVIRAASRHLGTDAVDVVLLNTAPISLAGRVLLGRRVIVDRRPHVRHAYESLTIRKFHDFRLREHRILAERRAHG